MCGIFGVIAKQNSGYDYKFLKEFTKDLALLSESRGKESAGFCVYDKDNSLINIIKGAETVSKVIKEGKFDSFVNETFNVHQKNPSEMSQPFAIMGHSRLVTNGTELLEFNNQPVIKDGLVGIHNGIITNVDDLWKRFPMLQRNYEVDTEVMLSMIRFNLLKSRTVVEAVYNSINTIKGTVSTALFFNDRNCLVLYTNNGSLYKLKNKRNDIVAFASEKFFLIELAKDKNFTDRIGEYEIIHVKPFTGYIYNLETLEAEFFRTDKELNGIAKKEYLVSSAYNIRSTNIEKNADDYKGYLSGDVHVNLSKDAKLKSILQYNIDAVRKMRRCKKCLLPETFPFIKFDAQGICNVCHNYKPVNQPKPLSVLMDLVEPYRNKNGEPDCLVPFSGGRDSSYSLHVIKKELNLNPISFTYDWGMVTDLARRNIARVCGKLGIENILLSANIKVKRENINKNISAWLKKPDLGMIPLFMIGDKTVFHYYNKIKEQTNIKLNIWGTNALENTDFKVGFAGLDFDFKKKTIYTLSVINKLKLFGHIGKNIITNPSYINSSVLDTIGAFASRNFAAKKDYYHLYDYHRWEEKKIEDTLINEYEWELATDTRSSWRIGDGTAAFYNYIYFTVAGFSEADTFRSNQIREGMITREEGLRLIEEENYPRFDTMKWYFEVTNLDFETVVKTVNKIPKLYHI